MNVEVTVERPPGCIRITAGARILYEGRLTEPASGEHGDA